MKAPARFCGSTVFKVTARAVSLVVVPLALSGCATDDPTVDLQQYVEETQARQRPHIEPLPEIKPYKTFLYQALLDEYRNPFAPADENDVVQQVETRQAMSGGLAPDLNRRKEALEQYPLDALRMQGTLVQAGVSWALVTAPDGSVHRVQVDNYVGQNHGRIMSISEDSVGVVELVSDGISGWQERDASLALNQ